MGNLGGYVAFGERATNVVGNPPQDAAQNRLNGLRFAKSGHFSQLSFIIFRKFRREIGLETTSRSILPALPLKRSPSGVPAFCWGLNLSFRTHVAESMGCLGT